ncbi:uncharacterized protein CLUP02_17520 [Colletotrichum lupini]|uniref:Uncharacterized protein n=1 Tax=Colletotrichum lupini TaxID=145971 RepID=A0A9Q8WB14_9PEZI|nr:uncharacterized protein CLUP02_17520 [Colletotrichum lupini]UQC76010.1 hypothetical protein CLUP02_17520 [Colletotrichum lupini]
MRKAQRDICLPWLPLNLFLGLIRSLGSPLPRCISRWHYLPEALSPTLERHIYSLAMRHRASIGPLFSLRFVFLAFFWLLPCYTTSFCTDTCPETLFLLDKHPPLGGRKNANHGNCAVQNLEQVWYHVFVRFQTNISKRGLCLHTFDKSSYPYSMSIESPGPFWYHTTACHMFSLSVSLLPSVLLLVSTLLLPGPTSQECLAGRPTGRQESQTDPATATVRDRVLFIIGHSVTKKQVCRESYQKVMALLPGPAEISRYMWRTHRRLDRVCISNEASISRLSCLDMYETCTEAGEDKVEQNLKGGLDLAYNEPPPSLYGLRQKDPVCWLPREIIKKAVKKEISSSCSTTSNLVSSNPSMLTFRCSRCLRGTRLSRKVNPASVSLRHSNDRKCSVTWSLGLVTTEHAIPPAVAGLYPSRQQNSFQVTQEGFSRKGFHIMTIWQSKREKELAVLGKTSRITHSGSDRCLSVSSARLVPKSASVSLKTPNLVESWPLPRDRHDIMGCNCASTEKPLLDDPLTDRVSITLPLTSNLANVGTQISEFVRFLLPDWDCQSRIVKRTRLRQQAFLPPSATSCFVSMTGSLTMVIGKGSGAVDHPGYPPRLPSGIPGDPYKSTRIQYVAPLAKVNDEHRVHPRRTLFSRPVSGPPVRSLPRAFVDATLDGPLMIDPWIHRLPGPLDVEASAATLLTWLTWLGYHNNSGFPNRMTRVAKRETTLPGYHDVPNMDPSLIRDSPTRADLANMMSCDMAASCIETAIISQSQIRGWFESRPTLETCRAVDRQSGSCPCPGRGTFFAHPNAQTMRLAQGGKVLLWRALPLPPDSFSDSARTEQGHLGVWDLEVRVKLGLTSG